MNEPGETNRLKRKIKVCHIITKMVYGGASLGTLRLAKEVNRDKFESTIICGHQSKDEGNLFKDKGNHFCNIVIIPEIVRELNPIKELIVFLKLIKIFKEYRYDIVHTHGSRVSVTVRLAAAFCRIPIIIYTIHGWSLKAGLSFTFIFRLVERLLARFTTKFLFQTKADLEEAKMYKIGISSQYLLIGNGIDLKPFITYDNSRTKRIKQLMGWQGQKIVGTVGRVSVAKNPTGFVNIAKHVLNQREDVIFVFVGGGELLKEMRDNVNKEGLQDYIMFTGVRKDIPKIMSTFDIFILPSLWEGMPRSVIEAMALGKPVIAHKIGGIDEIIKDGVNGSTVQINETKVFAEKIQLLLDNTLLYKKINKTNKSAALKYDFKTVVNKTQMLYSELISYT